MLTLNNIFRLFVDDSLKAAEQLIDIFMKFYVFIPKIRVDKLKP